MMGSKGFTLVEILIVVIILGILAAIVIPQFTEASEDARESALASDLQTLRSQIELYKVQHNDRYPSQDSGEAVGDMDGGEFVTDLTSVTNSAGTTAAGDGALNYGPYLQAFPDNPFVDGDAGSQVTVGSGDVPADCATGWYFNTDNGKVSPGDSDHSDL
ncbi:MAG: prepilin-type N-terminal cleavage/methylation domain-containing protein [Phycisphaerae bacterium]|nr:prepilin-type N-terminal cleavage/methylation domain-containing protein [Phycisphaerae bacterium]